MLIYTLAMNSSSDLNKTSGGAPKVSNDEKLGY